MCGGPVPGAVPGAASRGCPRPPAWAQPSEEGRGQRRGILGQHCRGTFCGNRGLLTWCRLDSFYSFGGKALMKSLTGKEKHPDQDGGLRRGCGCWASPTRDFLLFSVPLLRPAFLDSSITAT